MNFGAMTSEIPCPANKPMGFPGEKPRTVPQGVSGAERCLAARSQGLCGLQKGRGHEAAGGLGLTEFGKPDKLPPLQGVSRVDTIAERRAGGRIFCRRADVAQWESNRLVSGRLRVRAPSSASVVGRMDAVAGPARGGATAVKGGYPSGQRGLTVNQLADAFGGSNPSPPTGSFRQESRSAGGKGSRAGPHSSDGRAHPW